MEVKAAQRHGIPSTTGTRATLWINRGNAGKTRRHRAGSDSRRPFSHSTRRDINSERKLSRSPVDSGKPAEGNEFFPFYTRYRRCQHAGHRQNFRLMYKHDEGEGAPQRILDNSGSNR
jgi:hypothetical protein